MNINAKKSLGQNFLINQEIINKIVNEIKYNNDDLVIEIGPGKGSLTQELVKTNASILCYEIDLRMKEILNKIDSSNLKIVYEDFLKRDIKKDIEMYNCKDIYVVANIPYYITTPLIQKIIQSNINPKNMLLMVQKEVSQRLCAKPNSKEYGYITAYLNYYFDVTELLYVSRNNFNPIPNVDSAVIKFTLKENRNIAKDEKHFFQLLKDSFSFKRKTLKNNLKSYDWQTIKKILCSRDISENVRAEALDLDTFVEISNTLVNNFK